MRMLFKRKQVTTELGGENSILSDSLLFHLTNGKRSREFLWSSEQFKLHSDVWLWLNEFFTESLFAQHIAHPFPWTHTQIFNHRNRIVDAFVRTFALELHVRGALQFDLNYAYAHHMNASFYFHFVAFAIVRYAFVYLPSILNGLEK